MIPCKATKDKSFRRANSGCKNLIKKPERLSRNENKNSPIPKGMLRLEPAKIKKCPTATEKTAIEII
jgi:hypothetical protein